MYVTYVVLLGAYYAFVCITAAKVFHLNGYFFAVIVTVRSYGHGWLCHTHLEHGTAESVTRQFSTELVCHALWHLWPFVLAMAMALPDQSIPIGTDDKFA